MTGAGIAAVGDAGEPVRGVPDSGGVRWACAIRACLRLPLLLRLDDRAGMFPALTDLLWTVGAEVSAAELFLRSNPSRAELFLRPEPWPTLAELFLLSREVRDDDRGGWRSDPRPEAVESLPSSSRIVAGAEGSVAAVRAVSSIADIGNNGMRWMLSTSNKL